MTTLRLGIIGFGTIATDIWIELSKLSDIQIEWAALLRPGSDKPLPESFKRFDGLQALLDWKPDLVIEAASQKAVQLHAADIACQGIDVVITSVGALADSSIHDHLFAQARKSGAQVIV